MNAATVASPGQRGPQRRRATLRIYQLIVIGLMAPTCLEATVRSPAIA